MDVYFNGYKIRYELLNRDFLPIRASQKISTINIFINLDDLFHKMHKPYTDKEFQCIGQYASKQLASNIINLAGHYKNWAIKEHMHPTIYLVYTTGQFSKLNVVCNEYREYARRIMKKDNETFYFINDSILNGISILPVISKYIPNVYSIDTNYLEPSSIPLFLSQAKPADWNLYISRDEYDLQYVYLDRWSLISPKGDNSTFVTSGNLWDYIKYKENILEDFYFAPKLFLWAKTILGDKYRSIPKLTRTGWKSIIQYLKDVSNVDYTQEIYELQLQKLISFVNQKKIDTTNFNNNLYCTDIEQQVAAFMDIDKAIILQQITDMMDITALNNTNNTIFKGFPLNLQFLLRESVSNNSEPHDKYEWKRKY